MTEVAVEEIITEHVKFQDSIYQRTREERDVKDRQIVEKETEIRELQMEVEKEGRFVKEAEARKLPVTDLQVRLANLTQRIDTIRSEVSLLESAKEAIRVGQRAQEMEYSELCKVLLSMKGHQAPLVRKVQDVHECFDSLPASWGVILDKDDVGMPTRYRLGIGDNVTKDISIKASSRTVSDFKPSELDWLPASALIPEIAPRKTVSRDEQNLNNRFLVYYAASEAKFYLSKTQLEFTKPRDQNSYYHSDRETVSRDFSDIAISLDAFVTKLLQEAGGSLDLEQEYLDNPLMKFLRQKILQLTSEKPTFPTSEELAASRDLHTRLKSNWDALIAAPWSGQLIDHLALLKYHLENGECARFWNKRLKNLYGFRIRTRDHSWLGGSIFLSPYIEKPLDTTRILVVKRQRDNEYSPQTIQLGNMFLEVHLHR